MSTEHIMNSHNSNPVLKRLKVLLLSRSEVTNKAKEDVKSLVNIFTDDILPEILDNLSTVTVEDLLNFRLVNRCWRDAATSVLLKRNMCEISLDFGRVYHPKKKTSAVSQVKPDLNRPKSLKCSSPSAPYKYYNVYKKGSSLSDLNHLLTTTHRFPTTSFRFHRDVWSVLRETCLPFDSVDLDQNQLDLHHFMLLYGKKIRKLTLCEEIDISTFKDFVNVHMPHLISLDVGEFNFIDAEKSEIQISPTQILSPSALLQLNEIVLPGDDYRSFEEDLIRSSPNLNCIRRVDVTSLEILLQVGKTHCIKNLYLCPTLHQMSTMQKFSKLLTDIIVRKDNVPRLKLNSLALDFAHVRNSQDQDQWNVVLKTIYLILSASAAGLKCLELHMYSSEFLVLFIPPLRRLNILKIFDCTTNLAIESSSFKTKIYYVGDVIGDAVRAGKITANLSVNDFTTPSLHNKGSNIIPQNYFPRLSNVKIHNYRKEQESSGILQEFFSVENPIEASCRVSLSPMAHDSLVLVTTLDLRTFSQIPQFESINMSQLFPNVLNLNIYYSFSNSLANWVWTFTKLERFKLYGLFGNHDANDVDSFFTGISPELCATFEKDLLTSTEPENSRFGQHCERTMPFIGDCTNLKLLEIIFNDKLNFKFVTKVTAARAFKEVNQRTKIVFSLNVSDMSVEEIQESRQFLDPVAAYIEIEMFE